MSQDSGSNNITSEMEGRLGALSFRRFFKRPVKSPRFYDALILDLYCRFLIDLTEGKFFPASAHSRSLLEQHVASLAVVNGPRARALYLRYVTLLKLREGQETEIPKDLWLMLIMMLANSYVEYVNRVQASFEDFRTHLNWIRNK